MMWCSRLVRFSIVAALAVNLGCKMDWGGDDFVCGEMWWGSSGTYTYDAGSSSSSYGYGSNGATPSGTASSNTTSPTPTSTSSSAPTGTGSCNRGTVRGRACAPSRAEAIAHAEVTVEGTDCDGQSVAQQALSNGDGRFTFADVPGQNRRVFLQKGSFRTERALSGASSTAGATSSTGAAQDGTDEHEVCFDPDAAKIAVVDGYYDRVQDLLARLGFAYDLHDASPSNYTYDYEKGTYVYTANPANLLLNREALLAYDILMVNCGSYVEESTFGDKWPTVVANLRAFLAAGKSIYASDWAFPVLEALYPDVADFIGEDTNASDVRSGWAPTQTVNATVTNATVAAQVGSDHVNVVFDLGGWAVMANATGASETLIKGNVMRQCSWDSSSCNASDLRTLNDAPLTILYRSSSGGKILYTSFHWEASGTEAMSKLLRAVLLML